MTGRLDQCARAILSSAVAIGILAGCDPRSTPPPVSPPVAEQSRAEQAMRIVLLDPPIERRDGTAPYTRIVREVRLRTDGDQATELRILASSCACVEHEIVPPLVEPGAIAVVSLAVRTNTDAHGGGVVTIGGSAGRRGD
ncbi:MAG: hypothetical protein KF817_07670 [Phycisphaeraceae bacterium]|nr:hypothetical protein [Phycisphaeraceae bacterium]